MISGSSASDKSVFHIKSSAEFANRLNSVFGGLDEVQGKHDKWTAETPLSPDLQKPDPSIDVDGCAARIFKRPRLPVSLKRKRQDDVVPDYIMNPHKWKKYSLANTPGITEESNTAVALQFMRDLKKTKEDIVCDTVKSGVIYVKPSAPEDDVHDEDHAAEKNCVSNFACCSVHKMPELVVGEKKRKATKTLLPIVKVAAAIKLDHLEENVEEEM